MKRFEVVIIGAGPGGLNCAQNLAEAGKQVLILDQKPEIGPKICGGGLTYKDMEYLKPPEEIIEKKFNSIILDSSNKKCRLNRDYFLLYTVPRKKLGQWQLKKLQKTKTVIKANTKVSKIENDHIILNNDEKIGFEYLVGADGASSITRNYLGLKTEKLIMCLQYIIPTKKYKNLEVFFDSEKFKSWYAWIFPYKDTVSIGCGNDPRFLPSKKLKENFHAWLKEKKIDHSKGEFQTHPINYDYRGYEFGNIFLVGAAAGLSSGFTGKGIYPALISGEEVAQKIINPNYKAHKIQELATLHKKHEKILNFFEKSGVFRNMEFNLFIALAKSKKISDYYEKLFL